MMSETKHRTLTQNNALHDYFTELAVRLNDAGLDQRQVFERMKEGAEIPWSKESVKESLWKPFQNVIIHETSTTKLDTKQVGEVYEILNRWTAERLGVSVEFPSRD